MRIHVWAPEFRGVDGGIQRFSRQLWESVQASRHVDHAHLVTLAGGSGMRPKLNFFKAAIGSALSRRPDGIVITHLHLARIGWLLWILRIPYVVCLHGIECWTLERGADRRAIAGAKASACVSRFTREVLEGLLAGRGPELLLYPDHLQPLPDQGAPRDQARQRLGLPANGDLLLTLGRLSAAERYKGHREVMRALAEDERLREPVYVIAGDGDDRGALEVEAEKLAIRERVIFLGRVRDEDLPDLYSACNGFVMPSWGEGFGIVFLEAMAHGLPVLGGSVDGSVDPLGNGEYGVLVDPHDDQSVRDGLVELVRCIRKPGPEWAPEKLRAWVETQFGPDRLLERTDDLLERVFLK